MDRKKDAELIIDQILSHIPKVVDGRSAITWMRESGSKNWRQMEWIGFWFEHFFEVNVAPQLQITEGPIFGKTQIDIRSKFVWDLKAHPDAKPSMILNDQEAFRTCIELESSIGFIVVEGTAEFDHTGDFKRWHDQFKGGKSSYVLAGDASGRVSRTRKISFRPNRVIAFAFEALHKVDLASEEGWLKPFQEGMRNSNGNSRRAKYMVSSMNDIPPEYILIDRKI